MCAKVILPIRFHNQALQAATEPLVNEDSIPTLETFGMALGEVTGTEIVVLGEDHIRIPTPEIIDDEEILSIRKTITDSLKLPVTIFREPSYIEIMAI